ncbi:uncharacterized protein LOC109605302 isoform X2 [Aethina tumida]|nr:uncharacterized protein LOC109605302 isoform X2 [Aethina tumida]
MVKKDLVLQRTMNNLKLLQIWSDSTNINYLYAKYALLVPLLYAAPLLMVYDFVYRFKSGIPFDEELPPVFFSMINVTCMIVQFMANIESMNSIRLDLSNMEFTMPSDFAKTRDTANRHSTFYGVSMYMFCISYAAANIFGENPCGNQIKGSDISCGIFLPSIMPFNINFFPVFQLIFLAQFLSTVHLLVGGATVMFMLYEIVLYIGNRMEHLCIILETIPNQRDEKVQKDTMKFCVQYHNFILSISKKTSRLFNKIFCFHIIFTGLVIAALINQALENINARFHLFGWLIALFLMCHSGQQITYISENLGQRIMFMCKWYKLNTSLQKDLRFILLCSQEPLVFPAGPFADLSYDLFIRIIKTAYSYTALIANTTDDT